MSDLARIDFVRIHMGMDHDLVQQVSPAIQDTLTFMSVEQGYEGGWSIRPVYVSQEKKSMYVLDIWGALSDHFFKTFGTYAPLFSIERLDVRWTVPGADAENLQQLCRVAAGRSKGRRNVQTFKSTSRTKKNGRHAGGVGIAFGSHKSTSRYIVYKRAGEAVAIEGQFSGDKLDKLLAKIPDADALGGVHSSYAANVIDELAFFTEGAIAAELGLEPGQVDKILTGDSDWVCLLSDEDLYHQTHLALGRLSPSQRTRLIDSFKRPEE